MPVARVSLRVTPGARQSAIVARHGSGWKASVVAPPERGRANADVVELVAGAVGVPRRLVTLVKGAGARDKVIEIDGMTTAEADRRLDAARRKGEDK